MFGGGFQGTEALGPEDLEGGPELGEGLGPRSIEALGSVAPFRNEARLLQHAKVLRDRGPCDVEASGDLRHREFLARDEAKDLAAAWLTQCCKRVYFLSVSRPLLNVKAAARVFVTDSRRNHDRTVRSPRARLARGSCSDVQLEVTERWSSSPKISRESRRGTGRRARSPSHLARVGRPRVLPLRTIASASSSRTGCASSRWGTRSTASSELDALAGRLAGDLGTVNAPLQKLFGTSAVRVLTASHAPLTWIGVNPTARALYRWSGRAAIDGVEREWSLILKAWVRDPKSDVPTQWDYWKREFLAYSSGILAELPGISAPRFLGGNDEDDSAHVWLEDVAPQGQSRWPADRYELAALHLGRFNGAYLADRPIPDAPFLTRTYLRSWANWIPWLDSVRSTDLWSHPLVAATIPAPPIERLERLHSMVGPIFDRLERLPQTFAHLDAWRTNLIDARSESGEERTVAIDWSFVGTAPAGQEAAILVGGSHIWLDADPDELAVLSKRAFAAYVDGLREAGWRGDERVVRFAYAASSALYLAPVLPFGISRIADPAGREFIERKSGRDARDVLRGWKLLLSHALELADEAEAMAQRLDE
jgi:hypothetical protein